MPSPASAQDGGLLTVRIDGTGDGAIVSDDGNIDCPGDCSQTYFQDVDVILTATPTQGSVFVGWQGGGCTGTGSCAVNSSQSPFVTAIFDLDTGGPGTPTFVLSVALQGDGDGTVTSNDQVINCNPTCTASYSNGETVTLSAVPAQGSVFQGWQGSGCSGTGACTVSLSQSRSVSAFFTLENTGGPDRLLSVSVGGDGSGSVSSNDQAINCPTTCSASYANGESVTLSASASTGSVFQGWQGGGCSGVAPCTLSMTDSRSVSALFALEQAPDTTLSVNLTGDGSGSVSSNDQAIDCLPTCSASYSGGETVVLTATAAPGSAFQGWQGGGCSGTGACSVSMSQSRSVAAAFAIDPDATPRVLTVAVSGNGSVSSDDQAIACPDVCNATYTGTETVVLAANPGSGAVFSGWEGGGCSGTGTCSVTLSQDVTVFASFVADDDGDGVPNDRPDRCPNTPPGTTVDEEGCGPNEQPGDDDNDSVPNPMDQCPNTPPGETVDSVGCSVTQPNPEDDDSDGVPNTIDQCPNTPAGQAVDEVGCSVGQQPDDGDGDGVPNTTDQCPNTPAGESVDAVGCSANDMIDDEDDDGVANPVDTCPNTPPGEQADATGCSPSQADDDGDGVADINDNCPATPAYVAAVDAEGCPAIVSFGNQLGQLGGLGANERVLGTRLDEICPMLVKLEDQRGLSAGEADLRSACLRLKDTDTTQDQAAFALREISFRELASLQNYAVDIATSQYRRVGARVGQLRAGGGSGGVSVSGLDIGVDGNAVPASALQSAVEQVLGLGASADDEVGMDFGKLGLFLQGDLDFGERDETTLESGYDLDSWSVSLGADYRFTQNTFGGLSLSAGEVEVDYALDGGGADISNWSVSVYGGWTINDSFYIDGLVSYSQSDIESRRNIRYNDAGGLFESSHDGDTEGDQLFVGLNTGYLLNRGQWRFGPTAALTFLDGTIDGFTETSANGSSMAWNFAVDEQDIESLRVSLGVQADYIFLTSFGVLIPGVRVNYILEQEDGSEDLGMRFVNNPFTDDELVSDRVYVRTDGRDSAFIDTSFTLSGQFIMGFSGYVSYQFYSGYEDYSRDGYSVGLRWDKPF